MIVALLFGLCAQSASPEEAVDAWRTVFRSPALLEEQEEQRDKQLWTISIAVPLAASVAAGAAAAGGWGLGVALKNPYVVVGAAGGAALAAFDLATWAGLSLWLPAGLPAWTLPVALLAADVAALATFPLALGGFVLYNNATTSWRSDSVTCSNTWDLNTAAFGVPAVTAVAATIAVVITVQLADAEAEGAAPAAIQRVRPW